MNKAVFEKVNQIEINNENFGSIYDTKKPNHLGDGIKSGIENIVKGVASGCKQIVLQPIHGAQEDGGLGFGKGLIKGLAQGVGLTAAGAGTGVFQIVRGLYNTKD